MSWSRRKVLLQNTVPISSQQRETGSGLAKQNWLTRESAPGIHHKSFNSSAKSSRYFVVERKNEIVKPAEQRKTPVCIFLLKVWILAWKATGVLKHFCIWSTGADWKQSSGIKENFGLLSASAVVLENNEWYTICLFKGFFLLRKRVPSFAKQVSSFRFDCWEIREDFTTIVHFCFVFLFLWRNKSKPCQLQSLSRSLMSRYSTKARMKLRDVSLPVFPLRDSSSGRPRYPLKWTKKEPDVCQVVTQAPPLVTTCNVNRANLRCTLGNTLHVGGGRGSRL